MKKYKYLLFDADHTLVDYNKDEIAAFRAVYEEIGVPVSDDLLLYSHRLSETVWTEAGLYDVHSERIQQQYHVLYRSHVKGVFERVFEKYPCNADVAALGELFLKRLEARGNLYDGAEEVLAALSQKTGGRYAISIATNGIIPIQTGRLQAIEKYVDKVYISESVGAIKPLPTFFERVLSDMGAKREECLMIGDSLSSDIVGAKGAGIDACWYNSKKKANESGVTPDFEITDLRELLAIL